MKGNEGGALLVTPLCLTHAQTTVRILGKNHVNLEGPNKQEA